MSHLKTILLGVAVLFVQYFLSEYLAIRQVRPDFLLVYIIYVAMREGRFAGVLYGFSFGLLEDLVGVGSLFGLAVLTKSITAFLVGSLQGKFSRMNPVMFHLSWILIVIIHFLVYIYVRFQTVFETSSVIFWKTWLFSLIYTFVFIALLQLLLPLHKVQRVG